MKLNESHKVNETIRAAVKHRQANKQTHAHCFDSPNNEAYQN